MESYWNQMMPWNSWGQFPGPQSWMPPQWGPSPCHHHCRHEDGYDDDYRPRKPETPSNYVDLDGNGKFKAGRDAEVLFDFDGNGQIDGEDVTKSKKALKAYDGIWSGEASKEDLALLKQFDANKDGKLDGDELKKSSFVGVDRNGDGKIGAGEVFSSDRIETARGNYQLQSLDLRTGSFASSSL